MRIEHKKELMLNKKSMIQKMHILLMNAIFREIPLLRILQVGSISGRN